MQRVKWYILYYLIFTASLQAGIISTVEVSGSGDSLLHREISQRLTDVLNASTLYSEENKSIDSLRSYFTGEAFITFSELLDKSRFKTVLKRYELTVLQKTDKATYLVRDIKLRVQLGETPGSPTQYLVVEFDKEATILDVYFSIEKRWWRKILDEKTDVEDLARRERILHYVEMYRTAYNRKDIGFIKDAFSDDALIIVGRVVKRAPQKTDYLKKSFLSQDKIEFLQLSKQEYIQRLSNAFTLNSFIKIQFDSLDVVRHNDYPEIYGIQLKQRWNSSTYSDEGFLFLMIDFRILEQPLIHVRAWQPQPFADSSVISLHDFEIVGSEP